MKFSLLSAGLSRGWERETSEVKGREVREEVRSYAKKASVIDPSLVFLLNLTTEELV